MCKELSQFKITAPLYSPKYISSYLDNYTSLVLMHDCIVYTQVVIMLDTHPALCTYNIIQASLTFDSSHLVT